MRLFHLLWLFILWLKMEKSLQSDVIKCRVPVIENGNVPGDTKEYNEHEVLHFECNPNYIPADQRPTTCTIQRGRGEWIPTPYCETTKCRLTLPPLEGTSYEPAYRNLFSPGQTVKVICGERHGISNFQNASATVTCKDDGDWTVRPLCIEVTCSNQRDPLVDDWRVQRITLNGTARYTCRSGYRSKDGANMATCTRDGWRPNPLCQEITCDKLNISNANIVNPKRRYTKNQRADYECKEGYIGRPTRICEENGWTGDSQCTEITCRRRDFETAEIQGNLKPEYSYNERVEYVCKSGYTGRFNLKCGQTGWLGQEQCRVIKCRVPVIENGNVPGDTQEYNEHEVLHFKCNPKYIPADQRPTTCTVQRGRAEWIPTPYCEATKCRLTLPPLEGTSYEPASRNLFSPGETVKVICGERHGISNLQNASATVTCNDDGEWTVRPLCIEVTCSNQRDPLVDNWRVQRITLTGTARYTCRSGYRSKDGTNMATCTRDGWRPNPLCQAIQCPVIHVDDNVLVDGSLERAASGNVVRFSCKSNTDTLVGPTEIYCDEHGSWSGNAPKCKGIKCEAPKIENGIVHGNIHEYDEHEVLHFSCNNKYKRTEDRPSTCTKIGLRAEWSPTPMCEPVKCRLTLPPPEGTGYEPAYRNVFTPDEQVTVTCGEKYWISSPQDISAVTTCTDTGEWTVSPVCKEVTCSFEIEPHVVILLLDWREEIKLGKSMRYGCRPNYRRTHYMATCTRDGWRPNPLCQAIQCPVIHVNDNVQVNGSLERAASGNVVRFSCKSNTDTLVGPTEIYCDEHGLWSGDAPKCKDVKCSLSLPRPEGTSYEPAYREEFTPDEQVTVTCGEKYWISSPRHISAVITCTDTGEWNVRPVCKEVTCSFDSEPHAYELNSEGWESTRLGKSKRYGCVRHYERTSYFAKCTRDGWKPNPLCREITCEPEDISHATLVNPKSRYKLGEKAVYECEEGYRGPLVRTCRDYGWSENPLCLRAI